MVDSPPKVFISYTQDSEQHKEQVLKLSNKLREDGVDCNIDQYNMAPPQGRPQWICEQIEQANFVLIVCTKAYYKLSNISEEVKWEGNIITNMLHKSAASHDKFIPVLFLRKNAEYIPSIFGGPYYTVNTDAGYEQLYRHLTDQPAVVKSELGKLKPLAPKQSQNAATQALAEKTGRDFNQFGKENRLSPQVNPQDEFTQCDDNTRQLIQEAFANLNRLPIHNPAYSQTVMMAGSILASTDKREDAARLFMQVRETTQSKEERALASFNLFQLHLHCGREGYAEALEDLNTAISIDPLRYALHDNHKYPIKRLLGAGGMGCVFLCQQRLKKNSLVAVKCFWKSNKGLLDEIFSEPLQLANLDSEYVLKPLDYNHVDTLGQERAFFVTEYISGAVDGEQWLERYGKLDLEAGLQAGLQIARGLRAAHEAGVYHLDLKPENVLLKRTDTGVTVKIIDFGLSHVAASLRDAAVTRQSRAGLSLFGQRVFGTLDYAPPEQRGNKKYGAPGAKSDVYAFGVTLYRLLTKEDPHCLRDAELPDHSDLRSLVTTCSKTNPEDRPSVIEVIERLEAAIAQLNDDKVEPKENKQKKQGRITVFLYTILRLFSLRNKYIYAVVPPFIIVGKSDSYRLLETTITPDEVSQHIKKLFSETQWTEPLCKYTGILLDAETRGFGESSYIVYVVSISHTDKKRSVGLYESRKYNKSRKKWKKYTKIIRLPATEKDDFDSVTLNLEDLNKSVQQLIQEEKIQVDFDPVKSPPAGISFDIYKNQSIVTFSRKKSSYVPLPISFFISGMFFLFGTKGESVGTVVFSTVLLVIGSIFLWWGRRIKGQLLLTKRKVRFQWFTLLGKRKEWSVEAHNIESIAVRGENSVSIHTGSDKKCVGDRLSKKELYWLKNCILHGISL